MRPLPKAWKRFLNRHLPRPPDAARGTTITQEGELRLESGKWIPFNAEQWFDATRCAFCWHARGRMAPLLTVVVEDAYEDGHGRLEAKLFGAVPVSKGAPSVELDRGELLRYLAELPWNPTAVRDNPELHFDEAPDGRSRVWAHDEASFVDFAFDANGDVMSIEAQNRVRGELGVQPWSARFLRYGEIEGARIPIEAEVAWGGPDEREVYWRGRITGFSWR